MYIHETTLYNKKKLKYLHLLQCLWYSRYQIWMSNKLLHSIYLQCLLSKGSHYLQDYVWTMHSQLSWQHCWQSKHVHSHAKYGPYLILDPTNFDMPESYISRLKFSKTRIVFVQCIGLMGELKRSSIWS